MRLEDMLTPEQVERMKSAATAPKRGRAPRQVESVPVPTKREVTPASPQPASPPVIHCTECELIIGPIDVSLCVAATGSFNGNCRGCNDLINPTMGSRKRRRLVRLYRYVEPENRWGLPNPDRS